MNMPTARSLTGQDKRPGKRLCRYAAVVSFSVLGLTMSGCVPTALYEREINQANAKVRAAQDRVTQLEAALDAQTKDKGRTIGVLTDRYMELQERNKRMTRKLNSFRDDLIAMQRDIAELKLVITKNMEKIKSTMANEMLIKLIDMEHRVDELLKKEAAEMPLPDDVLEEMKRQKESEAGKGAEEEGKPAAE